MSITIKITTDKNNDSVATSTLPFPKLIAYKNHGNPSPTKTSKILLPIEDETTISPSPCLATMTDEHKSGTEVAAAKNVNPITSSGTFHASPIRVAIHTIKYENTANHNKEPTNVRGHKCFFSLF